MKRALSGLVWMLVSFASASCADHRRPSLHTNVAMVCRSGQSLLVSAQADGRFRFNFAVLDSGALIRTLPVILAPRSEKTVMVRLDSARDTDVRWIVQAIERAGGVAYSPDNACLQPRSGLSSVRAGS